MWSQFSHVFSNRFVQNAKLDPALFFMADCSEMIEVRVRPASNTSCPRLTRVLPNLMCRLPKYWMAFRWSSTPAALSALRL